MRIFGANIDIAFGRADRDARDRHALDEEEGIALHQHAVGERAAVALVGVADDVLLISVDAGGRAPFDAGRKACPAAPAQARGQNLLDRRLRAQRQRALQAPKPAMAAIIVERQRVRQAAAGEDEPLLPREIGDVVDAAQRLGMRAAVSGSPPRTVGRLTRRDRTVTDAAGSRLHLDERLEPEEAARSGAHKLDVEAAAARLVARLRLRHDPRRRRAPKNPRERRRARSLRLALRCRDDRVDPIAVEAADRLARRAELREKERNCRGSKRFRRGGRNGCPRRRP